MRNKMLYKIRGQMYTPFSERIRTLEEKKKSYSDGTVETLGQEIYRSVSKKDYSNLQNYLTSIITKK